MNAMGYPSHYDGPAQVLDELARLSPAYRGMSFALIDRIGSAQWPCDENAPEGTEVLHPKAFPRARPPSCSPSTCRRRTRNDRYPLLLTTGRILSQYNVGTQTRRTEHRSGIPKTCWRSTSRTRPPAG